MSSGLYSHTTRAIGTVLTASIYNSDHVNHITNQNPTMTGAYSDNVGQFQSNVDPGGVGSESLAGNLAGELERLRFVIKRITGKAQWYVAPAANLDQTLNSVNAGLIAIAGATPLTLRRTENDTTERIVQEFGLGSGAGDKASIRVKGTGANNITELALFIGSTELIRFPTQLRMEAGGYMSTSNGTPILAGDVAAATSIFWQPFKSNVVPLKQAGGLIYMRTLSVLELQLNNPNHVANTLYDVFVDDETGTQRISTGPAWTNSGAGTSARGSGAGTTEIAFSDGAWRNVVSMTARNGASTYTVAAGLGLYVGTILIDASAGAISLHRTWGSSRRWPIWNYWNRQPLYLKAGDSTASWNYQTNTIRQSNNAAGNALVVLCGLAEEMIDLRFDQRVEYLPNSNSTVRSFNGVGWNSTTVMSGRRGAGGMAVSGGTASIPAPRMNLCAQFLQVPSLGRNDVNSLETADDINGTATWFGGEDDMVLSARWNG